MSCFDDEEVNDLSESGLVLDVLVECVRFGIPKDTDLKSDMLYHSGPADEPQ